MSNKQQNNKRVLTGAIILGVLVGLNLLVRYTRSTRTVQTPPASVISIPSAGISAAAPVRNRPPTSVATSTVSAGSSDLPMTGSAQQMLAVTSKLDQMWQSLTNLEKPLPAPDTNIRLLLADSDRFRLKLSVPIVIEPTIVASDTGIATPTVTRTLEILGEFKIRGRNKYLVREDNKVFLVNEGEELQPKSIAVEKTATDSYLVFDSVGSTHDLQLKAPVESQVDKAVSILQGNRTGQPFFRLKADEQLLPVGQPNQ